MVLILAALQCLNGNAGEPVENSKLPPAIYKRTVFLGDSITDGFTYPQLRAVRVSKQN